MCKIVACLETSSEDHQIATKIAIENPLGEDDCPESTMPLEEFIESVSKHQSEIPNLKIGSIAKVQYRVVKIQKSSTHSDFVNSRATPQLVEYLKPTKNSA